MQLFALHVNKSNVIESEEKFSIWLLCWLNALRMFAEHTEHFYSTQWMEYEIL